MAGGNGGLDCVAAVALSLLAADRWLQFPRAARRHPLLHGHDVRGARAGEVIRAVFSPTITLAELQTILNETQLK